MIKTTLVAALAGLALAAAIVACGAAGKGVSREGYPPVTTDAAGGGILKPTPRQQIEQLETDTAANLDRLGIEQPRPYLAGMPEDFRSLADIRTSCITPPSRGETCSAVCDLADHVCSNSTQICEIADQLAGDAWAAGKCQDGKRACEAARKRCCGCQ